MRTYCALLYFFLATAFTASGATVTLAWDPNSEPDVAGYTVHYGEVGGELNQVITTSETATHVPYLTAGRAYQFVVKAFTEHGIESEPSEAITYSVPAPTRLTLYWDRSDAPDLSHYTIYWRETSTPEFTALRPSGENYTFTSLLPGVRYHFMVRAFNAAGEDCELYRTGSVVMPAPGNWTATLRKTEASFTLNWDPSDAPDLSHYTVYWRETSTPEFTALRATGKDYTFTSLQPGVRYHFMVRAFNTTGEDCELYRTGSVVLPAPGKWTATLLKTQASYIGYDRVTGGDWQGIYGEKAAYIAGDAGSNLETSSATWVWETSSVDPAALQLASISFGGIAACWYDSENIEALIPYDGKGAQRLSVYSMDYERSGIQQNIEILDPNTRQVLSSIRIGSFPAGIYINFEIRGEVLLRVRRVMGPQAVASGIFLDRMAAY